MSETIETAATPPEPRQETAAASVRLPRVWPAAAVLGIFWIVFAVLRGTDLGMSLGFTGFLILMSATGAAALLLLVWWLAFSRIGWRERLVLLSAAIAGGAVAALLEHKTAGGVLIFYGLPVALTVWAIGVWALRNSSSGRRTAAVAALICLAWACFLLVRTEGLNGAGQFAVRFRWSKTPEEVYLAERAGKEKLATAGQPSHAAAMVLQPGDWPGFRGANRDGIVHDVRIATNWNEQPPRLVWKRRIGPAWSSVAVVGDRLFTQEQLGDNEAVVCLDAATGETLWSHQDENKRHEDGQGGPGPRATPTFADGRIFALGATGILNCLDATTGQRKWSRDLAADAGTKEPIWGFSSSPLVTDDVVVVLACGDFAADNSIKALRAYRAESGEPAWSAAAGKIGYSSPQLAALGDTKAVLAVSDSGLFAVDTSSGKPLWNHATPPGSAGVPRAVQPRVVASKGVLFDGGSGVGTVMLDVAHNSDGSWSEKEEWTSRFLKPSFNDFVVCGNAAYGFDSRMLTCIDLATGQRRWKGGRYGSGQVLLLADQPLLLVVTEEGAAVLVAADPDAHHELGRFQALQGKTWNHPVVAHGRLYIRNSEEFACYELGK
jgi:outer membrane protein assembly factor BamB